MRRRDFLSLATVAVSSHGLLTSEPVYGAAQATERDRFGGWTGKKFEATGPFRAEKDNC